MKCLSCDKLIEDKELVKVNGHYFHKRCLKRIEANKQEKKRRSSK